jgi:hypothetical protein
VDWFKGVAGLKKARNVFRSMGMKALSKGHLGN